MMPAMSYAARLSEYSDKGNCGDPEIPDSEDIIVEKVKLLAKQIQSSNGFLVAHTGAGISTKAGIPDFRGPQGVWTMEKKSREEEQNGEVKKKKNREELTENKETSSSLGKTWDFATPTLTHMALSGMMNDGKLHYIVSQNVDGLHLKSGISREFLSELHGNLFMEKCEKCQNEYLRNFDVGGVGFQYTGRKCQVLECQGNLKDTVLDWEDELPEMDLDRAEKFSEKAAISLCLGTSMQMEPASLLPLKTIENGGQMVIVNLQKTKKDEFAQLCLHCDTDRFMWLLTRELNITIPTFTRKDLFYFGNTHHISQPSRHHTWKFYLCGEQHNNPPSIIESVQIQFIPNVLIKGKNHSPKTIHLVEPPFEMKKKTTKNKPPLLNITIFFKKNIRGLIQPTFQMEYQVQFQKKDQFQEKQIEVAFLDYENLYTYQKDEYQQHQQKRKRNS